MASYIALGKCTPSYRHVCSIRAAKLATSPYMSNCMHVRPTTPLYTEPAARPMRILTSTPLGM
eukprot:27182-Pelagococcus_subviridis.AAC.2